MRTAEPPHSTPPAPGPASTAALIHAELIKAGVRLVVTIPDSKSSTLYNLIAGDPRIKTVRVAKEDEGVGICCGAYFGGVHSCLFMANAGFMTTCYPLATLSMFHRIPLFMLIANRGTLGDNAHFQEYQGLLTQKMLDAMGVSTWTVAEAAQAPIVAQAFKYSRLYKRATAVLLEGDALDADGGFRFLKPGAI
jgi:sulfopyruvate decarboxylase subunit alpha